MLRQLLSRVLRPVGWEVLRRSPFIGPDGIPLDMQDADFVRLYQACRVHSLCSVEPMFALYKAVEYIVRRDIPGDLVECGVYKGGSAMMMVYSLMHFRCARRRKIYLYDTFEGMSTPTKWDRDLTGDTAHRLLEIGSRETNPVWAYCPLEVVEGNMRATGYDPALLVFVKGMVEDTLPGAIPERISLLRLDTDWHASTHHELTHLYPALTRGGVLIVDDYGHWQGARKAADEYLASTRDPILLHRIDWSVRVGIRS
jgi:hypothetical protein